MAVDEGRALLSIVVERLGDLFEPRLCEIYAQLFTQVDRASLSRTRSANPAQDRDRRTPPETTNRVYVLSRVTLGADVAVTSVLLDAAKRRYPDAEIFFVGPKEILRAIRSRPANPPLPRPLCASWNAA